MSKYVRGYCTKVAHESSIHLNYVYPGVNCAAPIYSGLIDPSANVCPPVNPGALLGVVPLCHIFLNHDGTSHCFKFTTFPSGGVYTYYFAPGPRSCLSLAGVTATTCGKTDVFFQDLGNAFNANTGNYGTYDPLGWSIGLPDPRGLVGSKKFIVQDTGCSGDFATGCTTSTQHRRTLFYIVCGGVDGATEAYETDEGTCTCYLFLFTLDPVVCGAINAVNGP